ncbi:xanthine dehydrogenase family protein subunit M [Rhodococcus sp. KBS0724]|jgi:carbon-monoxide dehydrogenase medium subunit|uniref:FAD binding domain-containing protein n=1 Tax=Rhodococcus sp. KBS0724 TaxID=1179674 RepID=UPI00110D94FB|nr:xanthine dehydrogenase family protein subunit M [Rhodococcus sp. KBS0724]TSD46446.1 xanthine dehydrogenase family protein subunit M [Rhodococcus sp. KBS0724]
MQVPGSFEYERATGIDDAIGLLERLGNQARVVAGGHSLLPMMKLRLANPGYLIDINDLAEELGYIAVEDGHVRIGAMARHRQLLESDELADAFPIFRDAEKVIADPVVRNRGTIGGSLCQADPAEDLSTVCSVLEATCVVRGPSGTRDIPMAEFHVGPYETALNANEILVEIRIARRAHSSSAYAKVERRVGDWAITAAGTSVWMAGSAIAGARLGLTAVNSDPQALAAISEYLEGKAPSEEVYRRAGEMAEQACEPVTDQRGSADYKRHLAGELTVRTLRTTVARIGED